ncbi:RES domain-containing protein [Enterococcus plantarum]|nr:RES domain-containing protein [Enterococcus plantarum]
MKRRELDDKKENDVLLFSGDIKKDDIYIDDQGMVRFLFTGADVSKFDLSMILNNPLTGEDIVLNNSMEMPTSEAYMKQLTSSERLRAKEELAKTNLLLETDAAILDKLSRILEYKNGNLSTVVKNLIWSSIEAGVLMFRVRKIWDENVKIERVKDVSYVPDEKKEMIRYGRLNDREEQIMYLADTYLTAMKESRLKNGDKFYLSIFINVDKLNLVNISQQLESKGRYGEAEKKISEFLLSEFTKEVKDGKEYEYRISNLIAKHYYSYLANDLDGWLYPSVARNGAWNVALDKEMTDKKIRFLVSFYGEQTSISDFTLENPLIKNFKDDSLVELKTIINTKKIEKYDSKDIELIQKFWLSFK